MVFWQPQGSRQAKVSQWRWHREERFHLQLCLWESEKIKRHRHHRAFLWHPKGQQMMTHWWHTRMLTKTEIHAVRHTLTRPEVSSWAGPVSSIESGGWDGRSADDKPFPSPQESLPPIEHTQTEAQNISLITDGSQKIRKKFLCSFIFTDISSIGIYMPSQWQKLRTS